MKYIGGYSILDLTDANVSAQANACYNQDKPVLVYGANGERYFADTITKSGTSIIITKGGKTITIANDNTITSVGDIQVHLYRYAITIDDEGAIKTIFVTTNEKIDEEITQYSAIRKYIKDGDVVLDGALHDNPTSFIGFIFDISNNQYGGFGDDNNVVIATDEQFGLDSVVTSITLIAQLL